MKIKQANAGALTNIEVLDFLRSRNVTEDHMGCLGSVAPSECKVFDYLVKSASCNQSREIINDFIIKFAKFNLSKAEKLNIINLRPTTAAEIYPIVEMADDRMGETALEEISELVVEVLPPPPSKFEQHG